MKHTTLASVISASLLAVLAIALSASLAAGDLDWHRTLDKGIAAAKKSGRPLLVVTAWKKGVCASCDTWRDRVPKDEKVQAAFGRFELVEWLYDGLNGKVIAWTHENGSQHDDPSVLAFVARPDGTVIGKGADVYTPTSFAKWLDDQANHYERHYPRTRVPFVRAEVAVEGEGAEARATCAELDSARADEKPVLVYVGRNGRGNDAKKDKAKAKACRKFEKATLDAKSAVAATKNWVLLRLDVADEAHARLAGQLGVEKIPALLAFPPKAEKPIDLGGTLTGQALGARLKKLLSGD